MVVTWLVVMHCGKRERDDKRNAKRNDMIRISGEPAYV